MKKKQARLELIKTIISSKEIRSQEDLLKELAANGYLLTQATLSRDLKQLKVAKTANQQDKYVYVLPEQIASRRYSSSMQQGFQGGFLSLDFSGNMAVIHTRPGHASSLALDIDNYAHDAILGSIAGDDTIFMVLKEDASREDIKSALSEILNV